MKEKCKRIEKLIFFDDRGLSLVELLVAITIGAIVSVSIGSLLVFSLRMYGKQTVDVEMQHEMQTTSNFVIDSIMESDSFIVSKSKDTQNQERSDVVVLGKFEYSKSLLFSGYVFSIDKVDSTTKDGKLYMKKYVSKGLTSACVSSGEIVPDEIVEELTTGIVAKTNLLATNVQIFNLSPTEDSVQKVSTPYTYSNPFSVNLDLQFAKNGGTSDIKKELHDTIAIRNTIKPINTTTITVGGVDKIVEMTPVAVGVSNVWNQYYQHKLTSKKDELKITTETVQMEKALGRIQIPGTGGDFTILEIVPDYSDDYIQLGIGAANGDCIDYGHTNYGASFDRLTADDIANYYKGFNDAGSANDNFFINSGSVPGMVFLNTSNGIDVKNNELFKLNVLSNLLETNGVSLHKEHGIWDFSINDYCDVNRNALVEWEKTHSLVLNVCRPKDLKNNPQFLENVDMIVFACPADGGFKSANELYNKIKKTSRSSNPGDSGDITWDEVKKIYDLVVNEKVSIACPHAMNNTSEVGVGNNMNALFKMLYYVRKKDTIGADDNNWYCDFTSDISKGSGRDVFKDVKSIQDVEDIINILVSKHYNSESYLDRTDLLDYDYDNTGVKYPSVYRNQLIYNNDAVLMHYISDGKNGLLGLKKMGQYAENDTKSDPMTFGDIEIVGVSLDGDNGRRVPDWHGHWGMWGWIKDGDSIENKGIDRDYTYPEMRVYYQLDAVKLNKPVKVMDGSTQVEIDKVIYMNEFEYEYAKEHKSRVFCTVKCTKDCNNLFLNKKCIPYSYSEQGSGNHFGLCPVSTCNKEVGLASTYAPEPNDKIDGKTVDRVLECQIDMNITEGTAEGVGINVFNKYIKVTAEVVNGVTMGREGGDGTYYPIYPENNEKEIAVGTDYALVVVRDLFDLD